MKKITKSLIIILVSLLLAIIVLHNEPVLAAQATGVTSSYTYNIINKNSGKYINVNFGTDADGTNVTQYTNDGSIEQKFAVYYATSKDAYQIFPACNVDENIIRVLDVLRTGGASSGSIQSGCNVDIWRVGDDPAQFWKIISRGNGYYSIQLNSNQNLALTAIGTANGSGAGTGSTSPGNVIVQTYTGANNQLWRFEITPVLQSWDLVDSSKHLDWYSVSKYTRHVSIASDTWNNYKSGVIRNQTSSIDLNISDYSSNDGARGKTYINGKITLNSYYLNGDSDAAIISTCLHEIGHALGLGHRMYEVTSVMSSGRKEVTTLNVMDKWNYDKAYSRY